MLYLGNNHIGFDTQALGFPSVMGCQAVVYQTRQGIYGFHDMKGGGTADVDAAKADAFRSFVQGHHMAHATDALQIYGVINQTQQYGKDAAEVQKWRTMLLGIATALGFHGPVYGFRVDKHVSKNDSLYIRYDVDGNKCIIRYKRWSKMELDKTNQLVLQPNVQQALGKDSPYGQPAHFKVTNPFDDLYPVMRKGKTPSAVAPDEGDLNTVNPSALQQFQ
jgi:hypothetical protein